MNAEQERTNDFSFWQRVLYIFCKPNYLLMMFSITCLFVVSTGINFWITDFFISVLNVPQKQAFRYFALCGAVGPISGLIASGFIFDRIGGFNSY